MNPDAAACQRIIDAPTPFECFELPKRPVDPGTVRNLYLKFAVKVHPDKNKSELATQAFQILSDSFESLHDDEKQLALLRAPGSLSSSSSSSCPSHRKKRKRKVVDIADLVHQTNKWYSRGFEDVEAEITRMTNEFKEHLQKKTDKHEKQMEKRAEKRERKNKRIKKNLNYLYEKYGLDPSDEEDDSDEEKSSGYNYLEYVPEPEPSSSAPETDNQTPASGAETQVEVDEPATKPAESSKSSEVVCWICRRGFTSDAMLKLHCEKSELHRNNVEKANNPWGKFKSSFSAVQDPS